MTSEQAADRLGMLAVSFPKMQPAMQQQVYNQLRADEQEAVRVLFDYDDGQEHAPPPAQIEAPPEVLEALKRIASRPKAAPKPKAAAKATAAPTPPPAASDAKLADYLRQIADQLHQHQPAPPPAAPPKPKPAPRVPVDYSAKLAETRNIPAPARRPAPPPKPAPRPRVDYSAQIAAQRPAAPMYQPAPPAPKRKWELPVEVEIALTILLVIFIPVFIWWAASNCGATQVEVF